MINIYYLNGCPHSLKALETLQKYNIEHSKIESSNDKIKIKRDLDILMDKINRIFSVDNPEDLKKSDGKKRKKSIRRKSRKVKKYRSKRK